MNAFTSHFAFEFRTGLRNKSLLLLNYLFPLGFYLLAGALLTQLNPGFRDTLISAMVFFAILTSTMIGMPDPLVTARESGIFRSYRIHGIPERNILLIPVISTLVHMTLLAAIIIITAPLLFQAPLPADWGSFLLGSLLMALACSGIGLLLGVVAPDTRTTTLAGQGIFLPSMLIGGLMMPTSVLPETIARFSFLLPSSHAMNVVQGVSASVGSSVPSLDPLVSAGVLLAGTGLAFGLALYLFDWDRKNAARRGKPVYALLAVLPYVLATVLALVG